MTQTCREVGTECSTADSVFLREKQDALGKRWRALLSGLAAVRQRYASMTKWTPQQVLLIHPLDSIECDRLTSLDGSPLPVAKYASASLVTSSPRKGRERIIIATAFFFISRLTRFIAKRNFFFSEESESSSEPTSKEPTTPTTIVASLDKSILQVIVFHTSLDLIRSNDFLSS